MATRHSNAVCGRPLGLALCCALLLPGLAHAGGMATITNESGTPVIVQGVAVVGASIIRGKPYRLLKKGDTTPALKLPNTNTTLYIYDAATGKTLGAPVIPATTDDLYFAVVADTPPPKLKLEARKAPATMMKP